jgi:hypothetical protein
MRSPSREGRKPGEYREAAQLAAARGHRYVAALRAKAKTQRHAQTGPGRAIHWELRAGHAERSREARTTHYLNATWLDGWAVGGPLSTVHCGNWQGILPVNNEKRLEVVRVLQATGGNDWGGQQQQQQQQQQQRLLLLFSLLTLAEVPPSTIQSRKRRRAAMKAGRPSPRRPKEQIRQMLGRLG